MKRLFVLLGAFALLFGLASTPASAVVGGTTAITNPGVVSLWTMRDDPNVPHRNRCGGTLVGDQWVATAVHCWVQVLQGNEPEVRLGSVDNTSGYTRRTIVAVYTRPGFDANTFNFDSMMLKLDSPVPASVAKPMRIASGEPPVGQAGYVGGWGWPCETRNVPGCRVSVSGPMKTARVNVADDSQCANAYFWNTASYFCTIAGGPLPPAGQDDNMGCFGDSGAPYYTKNPDGTFTWWGSFNTDGDDPNGTSCATALDGGRPRGAVTNADHQWMANVMGGLVPPDGGTLAAKAARTSLGPWLG